MTRDRGLNLLPLVLANFPIISVGSFSDNLDRQKTLHHRALSIKVEHFPAISAPKKKAYPESKFSVKAIAIRPKRCKFGVVFDALAVLLKISAPVGKFPGCGCCRKMLTV